MMHRLPSNSEFSEMSGHLIACHTKRKWRAGMLTKLMEWLQMSFPLQLHKSCDLFRLKTSHTGSRRSVGGNLCSRVFRCCRIHHRTLLEALIRKCGWAPAPRQWCQLQKHWNWADAAAS